MLRKINIRSQLTAYGLLLGVIIGLFLDLYEVTIFGDVGLGIVYGPMLGIILGLFLGSRLYERQNNAKSD